MLPVTTITNEWEAFWNTLASNQLPFGEGPNHHHSLDSSLSGNRFCPWNQSSRWIHAHSAPPGCFCRTGRSCRTRHNIVFHTTDHKLFGECSRNGCHLGHEFHCDL